MVGVAQLVRALGCGPRGRGFETHHSPHLIHESEMIDSSVCFVVILCYNYKICKSHYLYEDKIQADLFNSTLIDYSIAAEPMESYQCI